LDLLAIFVGQDGILPPIVKSAVAFPHAAAPASHGSRMPSTDSKVTAAALTPLGITADSKKSKSMRLLQLVLFSFLLVGCRAPDAAETSHDASKWQGTWKLVSCTNEGQTQVADLQWIVDGDHYNIRLDQVTHTDPYPFKLDARRKRIEVIHHETPKGTYGGTLRGIYEISGNSLRVCYDLTGQHYPTSFEAPIGSRQVLYEFQRQ
jgi:uncharacterized protein (TIGR03067 family)